MPRQQRLLPYRLCAARYLPGPGSRYFGRGYDIAILQLDPKTVSGRNELVALPTYVREWPGGGVHCGVPASHLSQVESLQLLVRVACCLYASDVQCLTAL